MSDASSYPIEDTPFKALFGPSTDQKIKEYYSILNIDGDMLFKCGDYLGSGDEGFVYEIIGNDGQSYAHKVYKTMQYPRVEDFLYNYEMLKTLGVAPVLFYMGELNAERESVCSFFTIMEKI